MRRPARRRELEAGEPEGRRDDAGDQGPAPVGGRRLPVAGRDPVLRALPAATSGPSRTASTGPASDAALSSSSALPAWNSQSSVASTLCQCEFWPASSRK
jgi:hypothetical protein